MTGVKKVTRMTFEPGRYSSRRYYVSEQRIDVHLPAPNEPFNVLRFKITEEGGGETIISVYFDGSAEVAS